MKRFDKRIKDATDDLVIRVKPADINGAVCRDHQKCVIAKAILRQRGSTAKWVDVGNSVILVGTGKNTGLRYFLKDGAREHDGRFAPCAVQLTAPARRKIGERIGQPSGSHKKNRKRRSIPTR